MENREIRRAIRRWHHHLAVDDRRAYVDVPRVGGYLLELVGPVVAPTRVDRDSSVSQVNLYAVAIEFDLIVSIGRRTAPCQLTMLAPVQ